jgi:hypothetical protein
MHLPSIVTALGICACCGCANERRPVAATDASTGLATGSAATAATSAAAVPTAAPVPPDLGPAVQVVTQGLDPTPTSLLSGRLTVRMPPGARPEPRRTSIMAGPESAEEETRVILDHGQERLVLMAYELFALGAPDFERGVRADLATAFHEPRPSLARLVLPAPGVQLFEVLPGKLDTSSEAVLIEGLYVANPDGTVQYLAFYVNPPAATGTGGCAGLSEGTGIVAPKTSGAPNDAPVCRALAHRIATTLAIGTRQLSLRGGERRLELHLGGAQLVVRLPAGVVMTAQDGPDFTVYRLTQLGPLGSPAASLGIYVGGNPSYQHKQQDAAAKVEMVKGKALGQGVEWQIWSQPSGRVMAEVILPLPGSAGYQLHLFAGGAAGVELESMKQIAAELRVEPGAPTK